jgi:hypothetical protein
VISHFEPRVNWVVFELLQGRLGGRPSRGAGAARRPWVQLSADTNIVAWLPWPFGTKAALWPDKCEVVEEFTGSYGGGGGQKALVFDFTGGAFESAASASHMLPFGAHFAAAAVLRACVPKGNRNNFYLVVARFVAGGLRQYGASYTARLAAAARANSGLASEVSAAKLLRTSRPWSANSWPTTKKASRRAQPRRWPRTHATRATTCLRSPTR